MAGKASDNLLAWRLVKELAATGEILSAARNTDIDPPKASRLINALEDDLGFKIFERSHRPFTVTAKGKHLLNALQSLTETDRHLKNICRTVSSSSSSIRLRFAVETDSDASFLISLVSDYARIDPELAIEIVDHADPAFLEHRRAEVAYLPYLVKDDKFRCIPVATVFTLSLASPSYLQQRDTPSIPEDLSQHTVIVRSDAGYPAPHGLWKHHFYRSFSAGKLLRLDNRLALQAALEGIGIALDVPLSMALSHLKKGDLVSCINGWHREAGTTVCCVPTKC